MRAAVISDTHDLLRQEVTDIMESCDVIIHAGDVNTQKLAEQLEKRSLYILSGGTTMGNGLPACRKHSGLNWRASLLYDS